MKPIIPTLALAAALLVAPVALAQTPSEANVTYNEATTGGHLVIVPSVDLPEAGFVAIHDSTLVTAEDALGSVIGVSAALPAGTHTNVAVELGNVPGNPKGFTAAQNDTLIAMPHKDSNGNGVYDFVTSKGAHDGPFGGSHATHTFAGDIVIAAAKTSRSSAVLGLDQTGAGSSYKAAFVDLSEAGFLALHDKTLLDNEDPFGSVIGVSAPLAAGLHKDVVVQFGKNAPGATKTGPLASTQLVILMPHKDSNANGAYDFITSKGAQDGPFMGTTMTFAGHLDVATATYTVSNPYGMAAGGTTDASHGESSHGATTSKGMPAPALGLVLGALAAIVILARRQA